MTNYSYDQRSQLTGVDNALYPDESFGYDEAGNRSEATGYTTPIDNRTVSGPGGTTYTYDHEGNVKNFYNGQYYWTYTWDHRNRLAEASRSGLTIECEYDAFNRLIRMNNSQTDSIRQMAAERRHWRQNRNRRSEAFENMSTCVK